MNAEVLLFQLRMLQISLLSIYCCHSQSAGYRVVLSVTQGALANCWRIVASSGAGACKIRPSNSNDTEEVRKHQGSTWSWVGSFCQGTKVIVVSPVAAGTCSNCRLSVTPIQIAKESASQVAT